MTFSGFKRFHTYMLTKGLEELSASQLAYIYSVYNLIAASAQIIAAYLTLLLMKERKNYRNSDKNSLYIRVLNAIDINIDKDNGISIGTSNTRGLMPTTIPWDIPVVSVIGYSYSTPLCQTEIRSSKIIEEFVSLLDDDNEDFKKLLLTHKTRYDQLCIQLYVFIAREVLRKAKESVSFASPLLRDKTTWLLTAEDEDNYVKLVVKPLNNTYDITGADINKRVLTESLFDDTDFITALKSIAQEALDNVR